MVDFMSIYLAFSRSLLEFILIECIRWKTEIKRERETKESLVRIGHHFRFELKLQLSENCVLYWNCVLNSKQSRKKHAHCNTYSHILGGKSGYTDKLLCFGHAAAIFVIFQIQFTWLFPFWRAHSDSLHNCTIAHAV